VLQCVVVCCSVLLRVAACCSVCVTVCCSVAVRVFQCVGSVLPCVGSLLAMGWQYVVVRVAVYVAVHVCKVDTVCWSVLCCVEMYCSVLQCVSQYVASAKEYSMWQYVVVCCTVCCTLSRLQR